MNIRRYTPEDYPKTLELVKAVYGESTYKKVIQRFEWQYEKNPNNSKEDPVILVLEEGDKFIGMIGTFPQRLKIGNSIFPAYWIGDYMLHPDHRRGFHAINLINMLKKELPSLVVGFPVEFSIKIWTHAGGEQCCQLLRYSRLIKNASTNPSVVSKYKDHIQDFFNNRILKGIKITQIDFFDERFDRFWEKASKYYQAIQVRDSKFLNWRFSQCPHIIYKVLAAVKGKEILGYIVLRSKLEEGICEGSIVDLFVDRSHKAVSAVLMDVGIKSLKNSGCGIVKMTISSDDNYLIRILNQFSFFDNEKIDRGLFYNNSTNDVNPIIQESSNWFLTRADSDMDFTE